MTTDQDGHIFRIIIFGFVARRKENESRWSKGKGKVVPLRFLGNRGGGKIWLHSFLTLALHGGQWPASNICPFTLGNELVPITWKAGWLPEPISAVRTLYECLAPSCKDGCAVCSPVPAQTVVQSATLSLHKQLCSLQPCHCTNGCAVCSPVPAQTVVQSAALPLHKQLCNLQPVPSQTVVQSATLSLHKMQHRDALNHPVATVLFVYHEPQINVRPVTVATELHIRQIFSEQLGTLRNTNLQRTPGQTVWISAQSSCTLRCHNMWTAPPDPFGGKAKPSQISQQLFEAQRDFMWLSFGCDLFGITARITLSPYRAAHWWRHHSASCDCPVCCRQLQKLNRHPASESFILQGTWASRGRSRKDADTLVWY